MNLKNLFVVLAALQMGAASAAFAGKPEASSTPKPSAPSHSAPAPTHTAPAPTHTAPAPVKSTPSQPSRPSQTQAPQQAPSRPSQPAPAQKPPQAQQQPPRDTHAGKPTGSTPQQRPPQQTSQPSTQPSRPPTAPQPRTTMANKPPQVVSQKEVRVGSNIHKSEKLDNGVKRQAVIAPDGSAKKVETRPDGYKKISHVDASGHVQSSVTTHIDKRTGEQKVTTFQRLPDGATKQIHPNGSVTIKNRDGSYTRTLPTGERYSTKRVEFREGDRHGYRVEHVRYERGVEIRNTYIYNNYRSRWGYAYPVYAPVYATYGFLVTPAYYPWYYNPWTPYAYTWVAYRTTPWYGYCGGWCTPYPVYVGVHYWITDFLIADLIATRYAERVARDNQVLAEQTAVRTELRQVENELKDTEQDLKETREELAKTRAEEAALKKEIKDQLANQVKTTMAAIKDSKQVTLDDVIDESGVAKDTKFLFTVHTEINASEVDGGEQCTLAEGDIVRVENLVKNSDGSLSEVANVNVVASKGQEGCDAGSKINVSTTDLQEMINDFTQRVEKGIAKAKEEKEAGRLN